MRTEEDRGLGGGAAGGTRRPGRGAGAGRRADGARADRQPGEGEGPYRRLVIRGATLVDGSGAPPRGPVDIVIAGNRIESIRGAGTPGLPVPQERAPRDADREIDATGMTVMPGFVDVARP